MSIEMKISKRCELQNKRPSCPVLIVDDDPVFQTLLSGYLEQCGYNTHCCLTGEEAVEALRDERYRIVLCDWNLPGMSGLELIHYLRKREHDYHYIMMVTGKDADHEVIAGFNAGADDYLVKGARKLEIIARIDAGLRMILQQSELVRQKLEIERQSMLDPLTQVYNRRFLMTQGPREYKRAVRYGQPVSVLIGDIDFFKHVNDTYGHILGDQVLKEVSATLLNSIRVDIDWVARFGGEEFIVALPNTSAKNALLVAEKLRQEIEKQITHWNDHKVKVTISFGIACSEGNSDSESFKDLLTIADERLYKSKASGRNCCTGESEN